MHVSFFVLCESLPCLVGLAAEINKSNQIETSEKWVTVTSPDDLFKHGIGIDYKQMDCGKIFNN